VHRSNSGPQDMTLSDHQAVTSVVRTAQRLSCSTAYRPKDILVRTLSDHHTTSTRLEVECMPPTSKKLPALGTLHARHHYSPICRNSYTHSAARISGCLNLLGDYPLTACPLHGPSRQPRSQHQRSGTHDDTTTTSRRAARSLVHATNKQQAASTGDAACQASTKPYLQHPLHTHSSA
jgi:hypothetical protein